MSDRQDFWIVKLAHSAKRIDLSRMTLCNCHVSTPTMFPSGNLTITNIVSSRRSHMLHPKISNLKLQNSPKSKFLKGGIPENQLYLLENLCFFKKIFYHSIGSYDGVGILTRNCKNWLFAFKKHFFWTFWGHSCLYSQNPFNIKNYGNIWFSLWCVNEGIDISWIQQE